MKRYNIFGPPGCVTAEESNNGEWVQFEDVAKLEQSHAELLDVAHQVVENYYDGLGDEQSVARAARAAIAKAKEENP